MWGPLLAWNVLQLLAESIDEENPERVALDLFDRLRLRAPFARAFADLGFDGEEGWRVAARIKVVLLTGAGVGKEEDAPAEAEPLTSESAEPLATESPKPPLVEEESVSLSAALWQDPDVRWLSGLHPAGGHEYLVRESYEELLWWLLMPSLLRLAGEPAPRARTVRQMSKTVEEALATAEAANYRIDTLLAPPEATETAEALEPAEESEIVATEATLEEPVQQSADPVIEPVETYPAPR
jgi:hypothetical protein